MAKFYIDSGNVSFVVCANDAEGAALWAMHRTIDDKVCLYEDEAQVRAQLVEDAMLFDDTETENHDIPGNVPLEPMLEGLSEFGETIQISERGFGHNEAGCIQTEEIFRQWRQLMTAMDRLFDQMG
jgi:hypothetical protein